MENTLAYYTVILDKDQTPTHKLTTPFYYTRVELLDNVKHPSLLQFVFNYHGKIFYPTIPKLRKNMRYFLKMVGPFKNN